MKFLRILLSTIALFASTPAFADEFFGLTPSGSTEVYFPLSIVETSDVIANGCVDIGWTTISSTETVVVCEPPVSAGQSILSALAAPRYATPPRNFIRFNLANQQGYARVQVTGWQEIQTAFGQTQRTPLANENYHNNVTFFMIGLGGLYPPGTQFPNHASLNVDYNLTNEGLAGMLVIKVEPDGAFDQAGMLAGDLVTRIAKKGIKDTDDISDALHKAIKKETFEVEFYREGKKMLATVPRVFRPDAGPLPELAPIEEPTVSAPATTTIIQPEMSVADELMKLAELKEQGILSEEEFEQQKAKLLER